MAHDDGLDRRLFLAGVAAMAGLPGVAMAQGAPAAEQRMLSDRIASFITGFDLKNVPPLAIERARAAFVDTVGVMLAGVSSEPASIIREVVTSEGAAERATIVGTIFRTSAQSAAGLLVTESNKQGLTRSDQSI